MMITLKKFCYAVISGWAVLGILEIWEILPRFRWELPASAGILSIAGVALLWVKEKK